MAQGVNPTGTTALNAATGSGPEGVRRRAADSVGRRNEYAVQATIAEGILAHYMLKARLAPTYNRGFQKDFGGRVTDHGDTLTLRRLQTYGVQDGLSTWKPQKQLHELVTLKVSTIKGIQTYSEWNDAGLYGGEDYERESEMARNETLVYGIEQDCAQGYQEGLSMGVTPLSRSYDASNDLSSARLAAPGKDNEPRGSWPDNRLLAFMKAELDERGLTGRQYHAVLDTYTSTSFGRTALFTQQYGVGGAGQAAQSSGSLDGQMVAGWKIADGTLNGRFKFGKFTGSALTVNTSTAITNGRAWLTMNMANGDSLPVGTRFSIEGVQAINTRTGQPLGTLAQFIVDGNDSADGPGNGTDPASTGTTQRVHFFPPMRFATSAQLTKRYDPSGTSDANTITEQARRRNCSGAPANGADVYIMEPGYADPRGGDPVNNTNGSSGDAVHIRDALSEKTATRSFFMAQDAGVLIYSMPRIDPRSKDLPYVKVSLEGVKLEACIAIQSELAPQGGGTGQGDARPGMLTLYQAWTRIGVGVPEWEAGAMVTGMGVG